MTNDLGLPHIRFLNITKTLDENKKVTLVSCRRITTLKINNRVLRANFNGNEATITDEDVMPGTEVIAYWYCLGETEACPYL